MNDHGFLAMMDALLFITVIIVACSVVAGMSMDGAHDGSNASGLLESMVSSEIRLSDLSEGDDSIVRLSSIRNSDRILVLTDDGIVEEGDHDQLMEQKGIYYQFYETANALK